MRVHKSAPVAPSFRPPPPTRLTSSSFLHRVKVTPPHSGHVIVDLPTSLPPQSPFCTDSSNGRNSQLWHDNSRLLLGIVRSQLRVPPLFESLLHFGPCRVPPSSPVRLQPRVQTFVPLTIINGFRPHSLPSLAIVFFICAPSFGLPGHISIGSAISLRNKLLLGSISPQQQLQYQQAAPQYLRVLAAAHAPSVPRRAPTSSLSSLSASKRLMGSHSLLQFGWQVSGPLFFVPQPYLSTINSRHPVLPTPPISMPSFLANTHPQLVAPPPSQPST
ncbi:hypothetical protein C8R44DRAFT_872022 [Mycena epipterygia]|nr:hypothetical protein C8R44DRAFT_872022 [Mycena epipterygia]